MQVQDRYSLLAARWWPRCLTLAALLALPGLVLGLWLTPPAATQGEGYRILYLHVPVSWLALWCYLAMAACALGYLLTRRPLAAALMRAIAPSGCGMALLSLLTGALWGRPMWGTFWVWDARLTSMLLLFFLYLGFLSLSADSDDARATQGSALLAVVGAANVPVIYGAVFWWNTLHQGASLSLANGAQMADSMLLTLLLMLAALCCYTLAMTLWRLSLDRGEA